MSKTTVTATAQQILELARMHHVEYVPTPRDILAHNITRLAGDDVELDDIENLLIALQRGGYISRPELVLLQASYLNETRP
jgi:hypothetical protein